MMRYIHKFVLVSMFVLLCLTPTLAQEDNLRPIYNQDFTHNWYWSSDSQTLTFQRMSSGETILDQHWTAYDVESRTFTDMEPWPLQATIPDDINRVLTQQQKGSRKTNVFLSPDHRYAVTADSTATREWDVIIVDTIHDKVIDTGIAASSIEFAPHFFHITWSIDTETLIVSRSSLIDSEPTLFYYVTGYADGKLDTRQITHFDFEDNDYRISNVFDVSSTGDDVLLQGYNMALMTTGDQTPYPLIIWNKDGKHQILDGFDPRPNTRFIAASFAPDSENDILVVEERGLVRYPLETGELTVLREDINPERFRYGLFSPNGEQLMLYDEMYYTVYLFDVTSTLK
jgi:hypothetical protein